MKRIKKVLLNGLQSLTEIDLAFIVIQPDLFAPDYKPALGQEDLDLINLSSVEEALVMTIVTIPNDNPQMMTANLQGPVIINPKTRAAKQCISKNENHPLRKLILEIFQWRKSSASSSEKTQSIHYHR